MDTGYQAYSLLKTGKDYFGNPFPLFPHSVADFRTPVYIYSAGPSIAANGLSVMSVRLPSVIWSMLGIVSIYLAGAYLFKNPNIGLLAALTLGLSPWHVQYSRQSVETISLCTLLTLSVALFIKGLKSPKYLLVSGLFFGLSTAAYSPGKVFVPLFVFSLFLIYFQKVIRIPLKTLVMSSLLFLVVFLPIFADGVFGQSGMRFRELSVFTDPTTADTVKYRREEQAISSGIPKSVGMSPRFIDKVVYNKLTLWGKTIVDNYLSAFSTEYLFTKGDRELRHSPGKDSLGMLNLPEAAMIVLGTVILIITFTTPAQLIASWIFLGPVSASLTRWDNPHAARLLLMLPGLVLLISVGIYYLFKKSKLLFTGYLIVLLAAALFNYTYIFSNYSWESAAPFQYGFSQAVSEAVSVHSQYDKVILDFYSDSPLMAYLFTTKYDPKKLQVRQPLPVVDLLPGLKAQVFENMYLLLPGHRAWEDIKLPGRNLYIISNTHPSTKKLPTPISTINYPDSTPAFNTYSF
jgi:4-amino-4-deoxy-L-arabinose transferase-like glycosyltransferase